MNDFMSLTISVLIPTYRRPQDMQRCLEALAIQSHAPDEVIVVVRTTDLETNEMLQNIDRAALPLRIVSVTEPGVVQAMNAGLANVWTDVVAITDDDAAPHQDWIEKIVACFVANPDAGGVGGRDLMFVSGVLLRGQKHSVGRVPRVGRHIGNHHLGFGPARDVDVLKGVNSAYRTEAVKKVGFDTRLRGTGAQVHWEVSLGLALKRAGWRLIYDPQITVDHYLGRRFDEDQRTVFDPVAMENMAYNEMHARFDPDSILFRRALLCWALLVGTRDSPGFVQWIRFVPSERSVAGAKLSAAVRGRFKAWQDTNAVRKAAGHVAGTAPRNRAVRNE